MVAQPKGSVHLPNPAPFVVPSPNSFHRRPKKPCEAARSRSITPLTHNTVVDDKTTKGKPITKLVFNKLATPTGPSPTPPKVVDRSTRKPIASPGEQARGRKTKEQARGGSPAVAPSSIGGPLEPSKPQFGLIRFAGFLPSPDQSPLSRISTLRSSVYRSVPVKIRPLGTPVSVKGKDGGGETKAGVTAKTRAKVKGEAKTVVETSIGKRGATIRSSLLCPTCDRTFCPIDRETEISTAQPKIPTIILSPATPSTLLSTPSTAVELPSSNELDPLASGVQGEAGGDSPASLLLPSLDWFDGPPAGVTPLPFEQVTDLDEARAGDVASPLLSRETTLGGLVACDYFTEEPLSIEEERAMVGEQGVSPKVTIAVSSSKVQYISGEDQCKLSWVHHEEDSAPSDAPKARGEPGDLVTTGADVKPVVAVTDPTADCDSGTGDKVAMRESPALVLKPPGDDVAAATGDLEGVTAAPEVQQQRIDRFATDLRDTLQRRTLLQEGREVEYSTSGKDATMGEKVGASDQPQLTGIQSRIAAMFRSAGVKPTSNVPSPIRVRKLWAPELLENDRASRNEQTQREVEALRVMKRVGTGSIAIASTRAFGGEGEANAGALGVDDAKTDDLIPLNARGILHKYKGNGEEE